MSERRTRRDLLGRGSAEATAPAADESATRHPIVCLTREAMACLFEIQFPEKGVDRSAALRAFDRIDALERQLTVYRDDSEVSLLARNAVGTPCPVENRLFDLLVDCHRLWGETGGAFDITAGPLIRAWGFMRRQGRVPTENEIAQTRKIVGSDKVRLDPKARTIELAMSGMEINFGAIGKGYALDRVAEDLFAAGGTSFLLGAGQSSIRAMGTLPGQAGWPLDLAHPNQPGTLLGRVMLSDQAASTSGTAEQFFLHEGRRFGHIIDPRTGWPVEGVRQVTVVAPTAARAEALSTAFFVMGVDWSRHYCERNEEIGIVIVPENKDGSPGRPIVIGAINWTPAS